MVTIPWAKKKKTARDFARLRERLWGSVSSRRWNTACVVYIARKVLHTHTREILYTPGKFYTRGNYASTYTTCVHLINTCAYNTRRPNINAHIYTHCTCVLRVYTRCTNSDDKYLTRDFVAQTANGIYSFTTTRETTRKTNPTTKKKKKIVFNFYAPRQLVVEFVLFVARDCKIIVSYYKMNRLTTWGYSSDGRFVTVTHLWVSVCVCVSNVGNYIDVWDTRVYNVIITLQYVTNYGIGIAMNTTRHLLLHNERIPLLKVYVRKSEN